MWYTIFKCGFLDPDEEDTMAAKKHQEYGNESISALKGADRVAQAAGRHLWLGRAGGVRALGL